MWPSDWVLNDKEVLLVILLDWRPGYMFQRQTSESQRSQTGSRDEKPFILSCYTIPSPMFAFVTPLIFWISTDTSCDPIWASMPDLQPATANQRQSRNEAPPSPRSSQLGQLQDIHQVIDTLSNFQNSNVQFPFLNLKMIKIVYIVFCLLPLV